MPAARCPFDAVVWTRHPLPLRLSLVIEARQLAAAAAPKHAKPPRPERGPLQDTTRPPSPFRRSRLNRLSSPTRLRPSPAPGKRLFALLRAVVCTRVRVVQPSSTSPSRAPSRPTATCQTLRGPPILPSPPVPKAHQPCASLLQPPRPIARVTGGRLPRAHYGPGRATGKRSQARQGLRAQEWRLVRQRYRLLHRDYGECTS